MILASNDIFRIGNYVEAGLWIVIAVVFGILALRVVNSTSHRCIIAAAVFALFGLSDIVEVRTGAWWRPWWLLTWKAACVTAMLWLLWDYAQGRRIEK